VPVTRAGMASGTADLQRDLGGAIMQSIFGALLTAGYASAASTAISATGKNISDSVQSQLTKSFDGAEAIAQQYPKHADAITAAAKTSFLQGDQWTYLAGIVAVLFGGALIFLFFPRRDEERRLLAAYHAEDSATRGAASPQASAPRR
jgi:DHA2 family multidrug resistance protein-like MFS transporter